MEPLKIKKVHGPYLCKDGRKHVVIIYEGDYRQTVSYPKYLLEQHLGRRLESWETCDHINGDFTDDRIENLKAISREENSAQASDPAEIWTLTCIRCGKEFTRRASQERHNRKMGKVGPYCGRSCAGKASRELSVRK